jgi:hypothetical protein
MTGDFKKVKYILYSLFKIARSESGWGLDAGFSKSLSAGLSISSFIIRH